MKLIKRNCIYCNVLFETKSNIKKYCNSKCKKKYYYENNINGYADKSKERCKQYYHKKYNIDEEWTNKFKKRQKKYNKGINLDNESYKRDDKGRFIKTKDTQRYKRSFYNGKYIGEHRKIWIENYGEIPDGYIIHHINFNKKDNRIENLLLMSIIEHNKLHNKHKTNIRK